MFPSSLFRTVRGVNRKVLGDKMDAFPAPFFFYDTSYVAKLQVFYFKINTYLKIIILY